MLALLAVLTLALTAADHWTTYLCLRTPVAGWQVTEANPLASWLFANVGLVPGILIDSAVTLGALFFLMTTDWMPRPTKLGFLACVTLWTGWAVDNNLDGLYSIGLTLWGTGS